MCHKVCSQVATWFISTLPVRHFNYRGLHCQSYQHQKLFTVCYNIQQQYNMLKSQARPTSLVCVTIYGHNKLHLRLSYDIIYIRHAHLKVPLLILILYFLISCQCILSFTVRSSISITLPIQLIFIYIICAQMAFYLLPPYLAFYLTERFSCLIRHSCMYGNNLESQKVLLITFLKFNIC